MMIRTLTILALLGSPVLASADVPIRDMRHNGIDAVHMGAAIASDDKQVIVFIGTSQSVFETLKAAVSKLRNEGYPVAGLIVAATETDQKIEFYADGQLTATILNPELHDLFDKVMQVIEGDYRKIIVPRLSE